LLDEIAGKETAKQRQQIERFLLKISPPQVYGGPEGAEVEMIRAYERACAVMSQHISRNPKQMTVLEYYETLETLKQQSKKMQKVNGESH